MSDTELREELAAHRREFWTPVIQVALGAFLGTTATAGVVYLALRVWVSSALH